MGVEVDFQSKFLEEIQTFCKSYFFDFVIGSVHCIFGKQLCKLINDQENHQVDEKENLRKYYAEYIKENCKMMGLLPIEFIENYHTYTRKPVLISSDSHSINDFETTDNMRRKLFQDIYCKKE